MKLTLEFRGRRMRFKISFLRCAARSIWRPSGGSLLNPRKTFVGQTFRCGVVAPFSRPNDHSVGSRGVLWVNRGYFLGAGRGQGPGKGQKPAQKTVFRGGRPFFGCKPFRGLNTLKNALWGGGPAPQTTGGDGGMLWGEIGRAHV